MIQQPTKEKCLHCKKPAPKSSEVEGESICNKCTTLLNYRYKQLSENQYYLNPDISQILENLYLSNEDASVNLEVIEKYQIRAICMCGNFMITPFEKVKMNGKFQNIKYKKFFINDDSEQSIICHFQEAYNWIEECMAEGRNVLVHCMAGISRSASFVMAYLMKKKGISLEEAYIYVQERREFVLPNQGFRRQLEQYENILEKEKEKKKEKQKN